VAELSVGIAGLRTAMVTPDANVVGILRERFDGFLASGPSDWRVEITPPVASRPFSPDVVVTRDAGRAHFRVGRGDFSGSVDIVRRVADVTLTSPHDVSEAVSIESFVRILYSLALVDVAGVVLHAASLVRDGRAYLFCGPSGSGKTTVARLSPDATLLSDELSIVRLIDGEPVCFGTPFRGELNLAGHDRAARLVGVYFLRHGARHTVDMLKPGQALARLLANVLFFAREADVTAKVFGIAANVVEAVPCFDLAFRPDAGFWEVIRNA
jgi:hypothetical protein